MANDGKFITIESGRLKQEQGIQTSAGAGDASKLARTDATGRFDISLMPNGVGAPTKQLAASETIASGAFVNVYSNAGVIQIRNADASNSAKTADGYVLVGGASGATLTTYFAGINTALTSLAGGSLYWLGTIPGAAATIAPNGSGQLVQQLGRAVSTTELPFDPKQEIILV